MTAPTELEVYRRLIDTLEEAASCARQLAFLRGGDTGKLWFKVDEQVLTMRKVVISIAERPESRIRIIQ